MAVCWLHDSIEDTEVTWDDLLIEFNTDIADAVLLLSDTEKGNRAERQAASRERLSKAPGWVQSIKCADVISNVSSTVKHDLDFAKTYLEEKRLLLDVLNEADPSLRALAMSMIGRV
jgi:(p)ppGpp synthase/HD superfamily hydrolase